MITETVPALRPSPCSNRDVPSKDGPARHSGQNVITQRSMAKAYNDTGSLEYFNLLSKTPSA
jgi:hypothetical protein